MHISTLKEKLACRIADATYEKYQVEIYGLKMCDSCHDDFEIKVDMALLDLLNNYNKQLGCTCNLDKIKDLR